MPLVWDNDDIWIAKNGIFYTRANAAQMREKTFLKNIKYMGIYWLKNNDKKELRSLLPNFSLEQFHSWMKVNDRNISWQNEVILSPFSQYGSVGMPSFDVVKFTCPKEMKKYNKWLGTDYNIFRKPYLKKIPQPLDACEQFFEKNVLEIKELVKRYWRFNCSNS